MDHAWALASEVARDPLIVASFTIALGVVVARIVFRRSPFGRAIVRVALLVLLTIALLRGDIVPYRPMQPTDAPLHDLAVAVLKMTWWLWGAWLLVGLVRTLMVFERQRPESKLVQDLVAAVSYVAAVFAIIAYVLDLPIQGVLATSGVIAIILGLALQSTMNDLFSGLVLTFTRPYRPGDWIKLEGGTEGRVIEMDWRATCLLTGQHDLAIVPNSTIAKSNIVNIS
jgi:small-conductance mechanosensitive channel